MYVLLYNFLYDYFLLGLNNFNFNFGFFVELGINYVY